MTHIAKIHITNVNLSDSTLLDLKRDYKNLKRLVEALRKQLFEIDTKLTCISRSSPVVFQAMNPDLLSPLSTWKAAQKCEPLINALFFQNQVMTLLADEHIDALDLNQEPIILLKSHIPCPKI